MQGQRPATAAETLAVHVRVRPLNDFERGRGDHECVHCAEDGRTVQFVTQPERGRGGGGGGGVVKQLTFDSVQSGSSQVEVFRACGTQALLQDALQGYAVTIFAYGQTGSGKTYTISGDPDCEPDSEEAPPWSDAGPSGLIPRALGTLFAAIAQWTHEGRLSACSVRASYLELYNEQLNDLLNPTSTNLQLRTHAQTGPFVENLLQVDCESVADAMMVFAEGVRNRKVGSHQLNKDSSRSHCLMTLHLTAEHVGGTSNGKICFVDLAGSERIMESRTTGDALKETGHINRSLFTLGNVISALADPRKRGGHIPYRDSKLTRLLMDSLGGDGRTLMLACCSPSSHHLDETLNTLHFASRAKNITNRPVVQLDAQAAMSQQLQATYAQQLRALQEENAALRQRLARPPEPSPYAAAHLAYGAPAPPGTAGGCSVSSGLVSAGGSSRAERVAAAEHSELVALKQENANLRTTNELLRRSHETVLRENRQLQAKLERLEGVFVGGDAGSPSR